MDTDKIVCTNCGAVCKTTDEYCKRCWKRLSADAASLQPVKEEMTQSEWVYWELYIDKNADRYVDIYKENTDKKWFPHMNWSAFFFVLNWVLYRRMFKVAMLAFLITSLLFTLFFTAFLLPHRAEIQALQESASTLAALEIAEITAGAQLFSLLLVPLSCVFWGLFGDAIYKMHIEKNLHKQNGGTSVGELIGGRILISVVGSLLVEPVSALIILLFI